MAMADVKAVGMEPDWMLAKQVSSSSIESHYSQRASEVVRSTCGRTAAGVNMPTDMPHLQQEKRRIKQQLKAFDADFSTKHGRMVGVVVSI